jgi:hypothetical protein
MVFTSKTALKGEGPMTKAVKMRDVSRAVILSIVALGILALSSCGVDRPTTSAVSQMSTTCVSDPIVFGSDEGFVPRCEHYYTVDQAQSDIIYRGSAIAGYTIYLPLFTLSCFEYDDGIECNLQIPALNIIMWCDYNDDGSVICTQVLPR